ncbi:LysR family nitrogen assimilation transcriptional regulator [Paraburkholderia unamae]|uniref:LysR family transcriptional regulator n=1 Tax=Paraburkholderia unamae TaxID=219649 RepID=UPI000DC294F6|nr:LysR substrate-binding domain-containing protein [Paraburkholderia unamae]RAR51226.1 LysR family nitrogen assimilation transcriptional regulator [Paraburkholderia unamae]
MDSQLIEYFLRVADLGSINRAASDLRLSQPALSRHIALLEHQIGVKLFTRTKGGVVPTEAGRLLYERARPVLRQLEILVEQVGSRAAGQLSVGFPPSWRHLFTAQYVQALVAHYPGVSLRVHEDVSHALREVMHSGMLDIAIIPFEGGSPAGYRHTALLREPLVLVSNKRARLRPEKPVPLSHLDNLKLALPGKPNVIRTQIEHALARQGYAFKSIVEIDAMHLSIDLAREGSAHTVTPCCAVSAMSDQDVSWAPVRGMYITWALCENTARSHSAAVLEGRRLVLEQLSSIVAQGTWFGAQWLGDSLV